MIAGTLVVWLEAICTDRVWDEQRDLPRFRKAFHVLMSTSDRWPTPRKFLDALPSHVTPFQRPNRLESEKRRQSGLKHLGEIAKMLNIPPPKTPGDAA